jgi:hypothetical protein
MADGFAVSDNLPVVEISVVLVAVSDADARKGIGILHESLQKLGWKDGNN